MKRKINFQVTAISLFFLLFFGFFSIENQIVDTTEIGCNSAEEYCCYNIYNVTISGETGKITYSCTTGGSHQCYPCCD